ncbi:MAG: hypothetical protein C0614_00255 [Desulfuromonas sp.]|nr:MAG: hypothetical protein C0614_00255 [Desulfuromonas sp.]
MRTGHLAALLVGWLITCCLATTAFAADLFKQGQELLDAGKYTEAVKILGDASLENPTQLEIVNALGVAAFGLGDFETAAMVFERLLMLDPGSDITRLNLAKCYAQLGNFAMGKPYLYYLLEKPLSKEVKTLTEQALSGLDNESSAPLLQHAAAIGKELEKPFAKVSTEQLTRTSASFALPLKPVGMVVAVRGQALAENPFSGERRLIIKGEVFSNDRITTTVGSRLQVVFNDNTIVSLGPKSELLIDTYKWDASANKGQMKTVVDQGLFRVLGGLITKHSPESFSTETPAATIGIRGSLYAGFYDNETKELQVAFVGGKGVFVGNELGRTDLDQPGYWSSVLEGLAPSTAMPVTEGLSTLLSEGVGDDLILHHKAAACLENYASVFAEPPSDCDQVCFTCHKNDEVTEIGDQLQNPGALRVDEAYPALYPTKEPISEANSYDDNWAGLPTLQKVCRDCHTALSTVHDNHPIFKNVATNDQGELQVSEGFLLCTTCHNPHLDKSPLLRASNKGSQLCRSCHTSK